MVIFTLLAFAFNCDPWMSFLGSFLKIAFFYYEEFNKQFLQTGKCTCLCD